MKKLIFLVVLLAGFSLSSFAQFGKITFGGGLGLQFGDYTLINVAPQVGYNITSKLNLGAGISYTHFNEKYDNDRMKQTNNYLGFNVYGKYYPFQYVVLMIQPEINRMWQTVKNTRTGEKVELEKAIGVCLVGAGVRLGPVTAMLQYDLGQHAFSPYGSRIFYSIGYTFGF